MQQAKATRAIANVTEFLLRMWQHYAAAGPHSDVQLEHIHSRFGRFVECLMHSANATLPSAKPLSRAALGKEPPIKNPSAKNSLPIAFLSGTRQSLRRVQSRHSAKKSDRHGAGCVSTCFAECHVRGARQRFFNFFFKISLPSALPGRHSAKIFLFFLNNFFAECPARSALGKYFLIFFRNFFAECPVRAALGKYFFKKKSLPSALALALGKARN